jgi:antitoxin component of MazEF toxin-antitoxin module
MEIAYKGKFVKIGNSVGVIIPKPLLESLGWKLGDKISVDSGTGNTIVITRLEPNNTPIPTQAPQPQPQG